MRLFRWIVNLVDRDVAANSRPISLAGMIVPFLPFMLFVDGAPMDNYPRLGALALAMSIGWGLFVMWRLLRHVTGELGQHRKALGTARTWAMVIGTILFILLWAASEVWLSNRIGWPESYGFACHGRGCLLQDLYHSPLLLNGGNAYELGLFAILWALPGCIGAAIIYALLKRHRSNAIRKD